MGGGPTVSYNPEAPLAAKPILFSETFRRGKCASVKHGGRCSISVTPHIVFLPSTQQDFLATYSVPGAAPGTARKGPCSSSQPHCGRRRCDPRATAEQAESQSDRMSGPHGQEEAEPGV